MQAPRFVRPPTESERQALAAGLRSADAFTLRRSQIVLASARGERAPAIARSLGCSDQTVRNALRAFDARGVAALSAGSSRPHTSHAAFDAAEAMQIYSLLDNSPCQVTPSQAFELIDADPQDVEEAFRSALAVELLVLSAN